MKRFKNILLYADGATEPNQALERAVQLASQNNARLTVIDVIEEYKSSLQIQNRLGTNLNEALREYRRQALEEMIKPFDTGNLIDIKVSSGTPFVQVIHSVLWDHYDLLIKAARPPEGFSEKLFGSTDMHLMRKCPCPVWIENPDATHPYQRILAAVDPVDTESAYCARLVMDLATSLSQRESATLSVAHVWRALGESTLRSGRLRIPDDELEQYITQTLNHHQQALDELVGHYDLSSSDPDVYLLKGNPAAEINELCKELQTDLIVMGTVGRTGIPGFFIGNTAEEILQTTSASVLTVKPANFISPLVV